VVEMKNLSLTLGACLVVAAFGCGGGSGGSGIEGSKVISSLSDSELEAVCNDARAEFPTRTITCEGVMVTIGIEAEDCTTNDFLVKEGCTATVDQVLDCAAAFDAQTDAQFCESESPPAGCSAAVIACFGD
jgi:hypothetical protein